MSLPPRRFVTGVPISSATEVWQSWTLPPPRFHPPLIELLSIDFWMCALKFWLSSSLWWLDLARMQLLMVVGCSSSWFDFVEIPPSRRRWGKASGTRAMCWASHPCPLGRGSAGCGLTGFARSGYTYFWRCCNESTVPNIVWFFTTTWMGLVS